MRRCLITSKPAGNHGRVRVNDSSFSVNFARSCLNACGSSIRNVYILLLCGGSCNYSCELFLWAYSSDCVNVQQAHYSSQHITETLLFVYTFIVCRCILILLSLLSNANMLYVRILYETGCFIAIPITLKKPLIPLVFIFGKSNSIQKKIFQSIFADTIPKM